MSNLELEHLRAKGLAEIHAHYDRERAAIQARTAQQVARVDRELALMDEWVPVVIVLSIAVAVLIMGWLS